MGSLKQWTSFVLREKKTLVFVINNSLNSRMQYAKKFHSLWVSVHEEDGEERIGLNQIPSMNMIRV